MPSNTGLSNLSPTGIKQGYDNYRAGQGGQSAEQSNMGKYADYARKFNEARQGGLKGAARKGLEGSRFLII